MQKDNKVFNLLYKASFSKRRRPYMLSVDGRYFMISTINYPPNEAKQVKYMD